MMFQPSNFSPMMTARVNQANTSHQLRVSTTNLWKVTLGFLPIYANLYKRIYDQHGLDRLELQEARTLLKILLEKEAKRQGRADILTADNIESLTDIEEFLLSSSTASLPSVEWSDISESTDGGSASATSSWTDDSIKDRSSSASSSEYSSDYSNWRKEFHSEGATCDLHWMERFSRAVFGEI